MIKSKFGVHFNSVLDLGKKKVIETLIRNGANVNAGYGAVSPLHIASLHGKICKKNKISMQI